MIKVIMLLKRKEGITQEQFFRHWLERHAPLGLRILPGIRKYVQNHATRLPGGGEPQFDGVIELWLDDLETWRKWGEILFSDRGKVLREDEERFLDRSKTVFLITEEKVIVP